MIERILATIGVILGIGILIWFLAVAWYNSDKYY